MLRLKPVLTWPRVPYTRVLECRQAQLFCDSRDVYVGLRGKCQEVAGDKLGHPQSLCTGRKSVVIYVPDLMVVCVDALQKVH